MSSPTPFSLRIFVADGDPDGLRIVERIGWSGKALVFPRVAYPAVKSRPECNQTGVYLLTGPSEDGSGETLYIGEGDPVRPRLDAHFAKKDFWTRAVFFIAPGVFNKAHVQYLESALLARARAAKRFELDNGNAPTEPSLSEPDRADMDAFLQNILILLPIFGIHAFSKIEAARPLPKADAGLFLKGKGIQAEGFESTEGFVVRKGSLGSNEPAPSFASGVPATFKLWQELKERGVLVRDKDALRLTQDYVFSSPSSAAGVMLARSANGRVEWKSKDGRTLAEIQESQTKS